MPTFLKNLELEELSLVDKPANPLAFAPLYKRDTSSEGETMTEEVVKMTDDQQAEMDKMSKPMKDKMKMYMDKGMSYDKAKAMCNEEMKKSLEEEVETLKAENERLRKGLLDEGYVIKADTIEKKAEEEFIEVEGEQVNKADIPAPILKRLEEAEVEKAEAAVAKKAEETFPNMKPEVGKAIVKADFEDDILAALMALDGLMGEQMDEVGKTASTDGDMTDPNEKLNALAKKYAEEHETTFHKAYAEVVKTDAGKALTKEIYKKD
mgnify:FL=1